MSENEQDFIVQEDSKEIAKGSTDIALAEAKIDLNEESRAILEQIVGSNDEAEMMQLNHLFNINQRKKTTLRQDQLSILQDTLVAEAANRLANRPGELSNKELFDNMKIVQDIMERSQKQISSSEDAPPPLININQQEVNIGGSGGNLSRDSRERVKNAIMGILEGIGVNTNKAEDTIIEAEVVEVVDDDE